MMLLAILMGLGEVLWEKVSPIIYWVMAHPLITGIGAGGVVAAAVAAYKIKKYREPPSTKTVTELDAKLAELQRRKQNLEKE